MAFAKLHYVEIEVTIPVVEALVVVVGKAPQVVPIVPETPRTYEFHGQEYLGLYPYLDKTHSTLYMHTAIGVWVTLREWLDGEDPSPH
jgi:hypothetical protein